MNIFSREIKAHRKALIIWCIGVIFMVAGGMGKFSGMSQAGQSVNELFKDMPKSIQVIFGMADFDLSKASGFYGILYLYLSVMAAIHALLIGTDIIVKEERDKTSEFLMVKPISRRKIITFKLIAAFVNIVIFNLVTLAASIAIVGKLSNEENINQNIIILMFGMFMLQMIFMFLGAAIGAINKNSKLAGSLGMGMLMFTFILSMIIDLNKKIQSLKFITPFKYFEAKNLMYGQKIDIVYLIISIFIIVFSITIAYIFYNKRDLNI